MAGVAEYEVGDLNDNAPFLLGPTVPLAESTPVGGERGACH